MTRAAELAAVDRYCDVVPRSAATVEEHGTLRLFVPTSASYHPWYARPSGTAAVAARDLDAVLARQRALGLPESLEWVQSRPDGLAELAQAAGLTVQRHPLLVAASDELLPLDAQVAVRDAGADLDRVEAVGKVAFAHPGTDVGEQGLESLDGVPPYDADTLARRAARVAAGHPHVVAAWVDGGPVARGGCTVVGDTAEITGVATLPAYRRRGLAAAVTSVLAKDAVRRGARLLFLAADDDTVARVYSRLGFREVGVACEATG
jgi:ribosomal protein S18 acetylase RimI-like enzyme